MRHRRSPHATKNTTGSRRSPPCSLAFVLSTGPVAGLPIAAF